MTGLNRRAWENLRRNPAVICQFSAFGSKTMTLPPQERRVGMTVLMPLPDRLGATISVEVSPRWPMILEERRGGTW